MATTKDPVELHGNNNAGRVMTYSCADGTGIPILTPLKLSGERTAAASDGQADTFVGVASSEKVADDGETTIGAYTCGVFEFPTSATVSVGDLIQMSATAGEVEVNNSQTNPSLIVGTALSSDSDGYVSVRINK